MNNKDKFRLAVQYNFITADELVNYQAACDLAELERKDGKQRLNDSDNRFINDTTAKIEAFNTWYSDSEHSIKVVRVDDLTQEEKEEFKDDIEALHDEDSEEFNECEWEKKQLMNK